MHRLFRIAIVLVAIGGPSVALEAQGADRRRVQAPRAQPSSDAARDSLEQRVRTRMANLLRTQLGLTDAQMERLQATNARFEQRRRDLFQREREARLALRELMRVRDTARQSEAGELLDRVVAVQRQRAELLEEEQRELATFLTPMQRARYFGMEEQIRRRVQEMGERDRGGDRQPSRRPGTPPGRRPN